MAEQIIGASGLPMLHITPAGAAVISGDFSVNVDLTTADYVSIVGSPNYSLPIIGSVQVSSITGALPAGTNILGSVKAEITNATINVDVTVSDYVSIVGSPNYNLPVIGSVNVSNINQYTYVDGDARGAARGVLAMVDDGTQIQSWISDTAGRPYVNIIGSPNYNLPVIGSVQVSSVVNALPAGTSILGSVKSEITASVPIDVNLTTADYISIVGSPNYNLPIIGSVEVSSIRNALPAGTNNIGDVDVLTLPSIPAGTNLIGSVIADIVGLTTSDYISIVGSPNYSLPVIGSVQVSSINAALPAGTALLGSVVADVVGLSTSDYISVVGSPNYNLPVIGSVQVSSINAALPAGTNNIGDVDIASAIPAGTNLIGSVVADVVGISTSDYISVVGSPNYRLPVIGSVEVSNQTQVWTGIGSVAVNYIEGSSINQSFDWVGPLAGSNIWSISSTQQINLTGVVASASGASLISVNFGSDALPQRIFKTALAAQGGVVREYSKPLKGPVGSSIFLWVSGAAAAGFITLNGFL